jgi:nitrite reductase/ring-hydroxylating ferredoxin subunit
MSEFDNKVVFSSASLVSEGLGLRFKMPMYGEYASGFVIRYEGAVYAYVNQCAHIPVELDWKEGEFFTAKKDFLICATHGAEYEPDTGHCVAGPCKGRSLKPMAVIEENEQIVVDIDSAKQYFNQ